MSSRARNTVAKFLAVVLSTIVLGALVGGLAAALRPQTYTSTTTVMVTPAQNLPSGQTESVSQYILSNMPTYNNLAMTSSVLNEAADHDRSTDDIAKDLSVEVPTGSSLVKLEYTDTNGQRSAAIADDLATGLRDSIRQFSPQSEGMSQVDVAIVQQAEAATSDNKPSVKRWALIGSGIGAVAGIALAQALGRRPGSHRHPSGATAVNRSSYSAS